MNIKGREWLKNAIQNIDKDGFADDIHIEELTESTNDRNILFKLCVNFFSDLVNSIPEKSKESNAYCLTLYINLSDSNQLDIGIDMDLNRLIKMIELSDNPSLIVFKPSYGFNNSIEFYRRPIPNHLFDNKNIQVFLKAFRDNNNDEFQREVCFYYEW